MRYPRWPLLLSGGTALWTLMALLVVVAWVRRRRQRALRRAEMLRVEHLEALARTIAFRAASPDNDEGPVEGWHSAPWAPWHAISVTGMRVEAGSRPDRPAVDDAAAKERHPS
jgi:hypothetical protein